MHQTFLYDFNFKFNNIIKTTLLTITIKKKNNKFICSRQELLYDSQII